jgi:peptidoglycan biosynthesis protein MviN/MurJ (putative lipid II flippase)
MLAAIVIMALLGLECVPLWFQELEVSSRTLLTLRLVKTLLPYMIFICSAAFGMGVLKCLGRFKASSSMPCLLNVFWIGALIWICFNPELKLDQRIYRVSVAILFAGAFQFLFMAWRMRCAGINPLPLFKGWRDEKVQKVWRNTALAALGAGAIQINYMLDQVLAQCAAPWAAGVIGYAERLMDLPLGIVGVAFGTVLLPAFAGFFAKKIGVKGVALTAFIGCLARFGIHYLSGVTIYAQYMPEEFFGLTMTNTSFYSILYNGSYMLPNTVIAVVCMALAQKPLQAFLTPQE